MSISDLNLDSRLGLVSYKIDEQNTHIHVEQAQCNKCTGKPCLTVCPAEVYKVLEDKIVARYENCLECGTCQLACDELGEQGIDWRPPVGGFGVIFRYG